MTKTAGNDSFFSRVLSKQNIVLMLSSLALALSYLAEVASPNVRRDWTVGCCGRSFWWSPVGCALLLVGAAYLFRLRRAWSWMSAVLLSGYVCCFCFYEAAESWNFFYSLNTMQALREAFLPLYRPLSAVLGLYILFESLARLVWRSNGPQSQPGGRGEVLPRRGKPMVQTDGVRQIDSERQS